MLHRRYAWLGLFNGLAGSRSDVTQTCDVTRVFLACLTVHPCDGGTGQNVVELVHQQRIPQWAQRLARGGAAGAHGRLTLAQFQQAQAQVRSALGRLIAVSESYPDLKANQNFLELQAQLEGTENRIAVARKDFNDMARTYNVAVRRFPANLVAGMFGFGQKPYFESAEGSEAAPQVTF